MSSLTVVQLKEELRRNGVSFEEGKLKKYYVDLHDDMKPSPSAVDFSDDESQATLSSPKRRRSLARTRPPVTPPKADPKDVSALDDVQLRIELLKHGHTPGPVTDTTRTLYRKMLSDSISPGGPPTPSKRGTAKKTASAPGTPAKRTPQRQQATTGLDMSDEETPDGGVVEVGAKSASKLTRDTTSSMRRRSEVDRLKLDNPGPQMAQAIPTTDSGIGTRSRRTATEGDTIDGHRTHDRKPPHAVSCQPAHANNRQWLIMIALFLLIAVSVVFAMQYGLPRKLTVAARRK